MLRPITVPEHVKENIRIPSLSPISLLQAQEMIEQTTQVTTLVLATTVCMAETLQMVKPGAAKAMY